MKVVKKAKIEVVTVDDLHEGDEILWSNFKSKVVNVDRYNRKVFFIPYSMPGEPFEASYRRYYRITECEETNVCTICGKEIERGDTCEECKERDFY